MESIDNEEIEKLLLDIRDVSQYVVYKDINYEKSLDKLNKLIKYVHDGKDDKYLKDKDDE